MKYDFEVIPITTKKPLTVKQKKILDFIKEYIAKNNYAPTIREIGEGNNLSSSATVHAYINILIEKGWLKKSDYKFRTLEIVGENEFLNEARGLYTLPIINDKKDFEEQIQNPTKKIDILQEQANVDNNSFIVKISNDDLFKKDDYIIVKPSNKYKEEDFVVILEDKHVKAVNYTKKLDNVIGKIIAVYKKF